MTRRATLLLATCLGLGLPVAAHAAVGDSNVASIEPNVPHPDETPCSVPLFSRAAFGANTVNFTYAPPAACPGPWAKIVLSTDVSLNSGRQFDRTASIWIGGVPVLLGTTAEPRAALAPNWHVERDVTDDTALLRTAQSGDVLIANYQSDVYTSTITASAKLLFYPASARYPAPQVPDLVIPLQTAGQTTTLNTGADSLSRTLTLPANIEKARLDVLLQSQNADEFWYTCVPDALAGALVTCGGGAFREGQVAIDGVRAGVAPVYPWIYTGGIDPYLWEPVPGVQTLAFDPFKVELTPFAGVLNSGGTHTVSLSVAGADSYFSVAGTLYLTLDHGSRTVPGAVTANTLAAPAPVTTNGIVTASGASTGSVLTTSRHDYSISGYALTSHGRVQTTIDQQDRFSNNQAFDVTAAIDDQTVTQTTETRTTVTTRSPSGTDIESRVLSYPLSLRYDYAVAADGSAVQDTAVRQALERDTLLTHDLVPVYASRLLEGVDPGDTLAFTAAGAVASHRGGGTAHYVSADSRTGCVTNTATTTDSVLTAQSRSTACDVKALLH